MARNKSYGGAVPVMKDNYQAECDRDTLMRAAEVVGSRLRLRAAMRMMKKQQMGASKMIHVLSKR